MKVQSVVSVCLAGIMIFVFGFADRVAAADRAVVLFDVPDFSHVLPVQRAAIFEAEMTTVAELIDTPRELYTPASQRFIDRAFSDVSSSLRTNADRTELQSLRKRLREHSDFAHDSLQHDFVNVSAKYGRDLSRGLWYGKLFGIAVKQIDFNARVLHERPADDQFRFFISNIGVLDQVIPELVMERRVLGAVRKGDWGATSDIGVRMMHSLLKNQDVHIAANATVAIVISDYDITSPGVRQGSGHLFLDMIHADGSSETIGGYPGSGNDFNRKDAQLTCGFNREPKGLVGTLGHYLTPSSGETLAALAKRFRDACNAFNEQERKNPIAYDPMAKGNNGYNDNSLLTGLFDSLGRKNDIDSLKLQSSQSQ
ncbi:MAG TPA: hypothetical protein VGZ00_06705 [Candidatus Baltobacteraceae bacterium]|nr:hypothetical protein [Candidatus Baltobacteraceae bacterium]